VGMGALARPAERSLGVGRGIVRRIERTHSANTGLEWAQVSVQKADANLGHPGLSGRTPTARTPV
jgi:hypothetical protein